VIAVVVVEAVVLAALTVLVAGLLRAYAEVLRRLRALDPDGAGGAAGGPAPFRVTPGTPAPPQPAGTGGAGGADEWPAAHDLRGQAPDGELLALRTLDVDHDTALLFLSSGCTTCATFWEELRHPLQLRVPPGVRLVVVTRGPDAEDPDGIAALAPPGVDVVLSTDAWTDYGVPGSPYVVLVDGRSGRVRGEGTGQSWRQVAELLARSTGRAGLVTGGPDPAKPGADARRESDVDRELLAAGILPGDPRLYEPAGPEVP
jgi:hypothetical protein